MSAPPLDEYNRKRDFGLTPEPAPGRATPRPHAPRFVIHKHHARQLHYDLRLEIDGALASWSVPRGPTFDPDVKRLAVQTEDHPLEYGDFEGRIPDGQYGAGDSLLWDRGGFDTVPPGQVAAQRRKGHIRFILQGEKLHGEWHLVRTTRPDGRRAAQGDLEASGARAQWLFFKALDGAATPGAKADITEARPESVVTGRSQTQGPGKSPPHAPKPSMPKLLATGVLAPGQPGGVPLAGLRGGPLFTPPRPEALQVDVTDPRALLALPSSLFSLPEPAAPKAPAELVLRIEAAHALADAAAVAQVVRGLFEKLAIPSLCTLAGPRALHVRVALAPGDRPESAAGFARTLARTLALSLPGVGVAGATGEPDGGVVISVTVDPRETGTGAPAPLEPCAEASKHACVPLDWAEVGPKLSAKVGLAASVKRRAQESDSLLRRYREQPVRLPAAR